MTQQKMNRTREIEQVPYGVILWEMPDGSFVSDDEGHFLMLETMKNDYARYKIFKDFVKSEFGIDEGRIHYKSGHRIVTDDEYEEQKQRLRWGLVPDVLDAPAMLEEAKRLKNGR